MKDWRFVAILAAMMGMFAAPAIAQTTAPASEAASKFDAAVKGAKKAEGLWNIYWKDQQILVDIKNAQLDQEYLFLTSIAQGVSSGPIIGGMTWGDDVVWSFRKVGEKLHVLRKNVRFKAKPGSPEASAVKFAYSDSVIYALPIAAETPGGQLVDMTRVFLSDDEQIGQFLGGGAAGFSSAGGPGAAFMFDRSTVNKVAAFSENVELQIAAVYSSPRAQNLETVPDPRGIQVNMHYSISRLPNTGYKPRKADDRVGYFLTVTKDFTDTSDPQHFIRYINRWDLQKADPAAKLSPPKTPITFWMEKTVPINLRPIVRSGIEEWNKAYEKLGFANAIEVRQQSEKDKWDPEDVNYNTFRWITAEAGFAMGPSRVNPYTGQILDADIIFDASFLRYWKQEYEHFTPAPVAEGFQTPVDRLLPWHRNRAACQLSAGMQHQMGFAAAALTAMGLVDKRGELPEEYLQQALKEVVMHEVGHTIGLRHNFKASAWKSLAELGDPAKAGEPTVASVMDYSPVNITSAGTAQPAYYTKTIGPYDYWAIEYGYKPISGDEAAELAKIASRGGEPGLDFATDEDTRGSIDPDPLSNRFDLGNDPVAYAERQIKVVQELLPKVADRMVDSGEGFQRARQAFGVLLRELSRTAQFAGRVPGGLYVHRDHKGDAKGRAPFKPVEAERQRAAMKLIGDVVFAAPKFDPNVLNSLAASRWSHWGITESARIDYPIHDTIASLQASTLAQLTSANTLTRIADGELKVPADQDCYTLAEHLQSLVKSVFTEILEPKPGDYTTRSPYVPSFRRRLQSTFATQLSNMVTRGASVDDARTLARMHLTKLEAALTAILAQADVKLDDYSRAHFTELQTRLKQVLTGDIVVVPGSTIRFD